MMKWGSRCVKNLQYLDMAKHYGIITNLDKTRTFIIRQPLLNVTNIRYCYTKQVLLITKNEVTKVQCKKLEPQLQVS